MSVLRIRYLGDPVLRARAEPVTEITDELRCLARDMIETLLDEPGLGLAAPQVGESRRLVVVRIISPLDEDRSEEEVEDDEEEIEVQALINPEIIEAGDDLLVSREGCLSLPTLYGDVPRAREVVVRAVTIAGDEIQMHAEGLMARILQHELDHLDGTVFLDRADPDSLVWLVPDEDEESGRREDPTSVEEALARFERLAHRRAGRGERD